MLPYDVLGVLETAWLAFLTRGLHLDGLADTADGLGGGNARERVLLIMKDSHVGAFGVTALMLVLLLKSACFSGLSRTGSWQVIVLAPCFSRFSLAVLAPLSRYARPEGGLGQAFTGKKTRWTLALSAPTALCAGWALMGITGIVGALLAGFFGIAAAVFYHYRLGGVTGDLLGAQVELSETLILLAGLSYLS